MRKSTDRLLKTTHNSHLHKSLWIIGQQTPVRVTKRLPSLLAKLPLDVSHTLTVFPASQLPHFCNHWHWLEDTLQSPEAGNRLQVDWRFFYKAALTKSRECSHGTEFQFDGQRILSDANGQIFFSRLHCAQTRPRGRGDKHFGELSGMDWRWKSKRGQITTSA